MFMMPRADCRPVLSLAVRGGLSNQKECLVNAGIVARALNVTLALPHFDLIGRGNEKFEPSNARYVGPYSERDRWGHFSHLFNATQLIASLEGKLSTLLRLRTLVLPSGLRPHTVRLPAVENVAPDCAGRRRLQGTCEARRGDSTLLDKLITSWGGLIREECAHARPDGSSSRAIVFDAGQSLCWNAYKSRHASLCARQYPFCQDMLKALRWNRIITRLHTKVQQGLQRSANGTWAAVHVRAFICSRNKREPSFTHVRSALSQLGIHGGLIYLVSSVPPQQLQAALTTFTIVSKASFLGSEVRRKYPFEVLAAIDYGVAVASPRYLGEPETSSFDAFAAEERTRHGMPAIDPIPGACGD